MSNALIVVDMQRGFMAPGGTLYCGDAARAIIPPVRLLIESEAGRGALVIFTADTHAPDDKEFAMFPPHCVAGTPEVEIIPELADLAAQHAVLPKRRYSAFFDTDLGEQLAAFGPEQIIVVGDCTDICVLHTVAGLRDRDYRVIVRSDLVETYDAPGHPADEVNACALAHLRDVLGAEVV